jgi:hypothetical protein
MKDVLEPSLVLRFVAMYDAETCSEATTKFIHCAKRNLRPVSRVGTRGSSTGWLASPMTRLFVSH